MSFERIQYYYEAGLWSKPMVKMAVRKGVITREQYRDITGEDYTIPGTDVTHRVVRIRKVRPTPKTFPRAFAKIKKNPLR